MLSAYQRCSVRFDRQLFVRGLESYCVVCNFSFAYGDIQHFILSFVYVLRSVLWCPFRCSVFDSSLPPVVTCMRVHSYFFSVCLRIVVCFFVLFVFVLCLVYPMLPVSLDCLIFLLPLLYSLTFIQKERLKRTTKSEIAPQTLDLHQIWPVKYGCGSLIEFCLKKICSLWIAILPKCTSVCR